MHITQPIIRIRHPNGAKEREKKRKKKGKEKEKEKEEIPELSRLKKNEFSRILDVLEVRVYVLFS